MKDDWGIQFPHKFQIRAIYHIAFQLDQILYIVDKTGSGKSAIPLTIGSLQTGVTAAAVAAVVAAPLSLLSPSLAAPPCLCIAATLLSSQFLAD